MSEVPSPLKACRNEWEAWPFAIWPSRFVLPHEAQRLFADTELAEDGVEQVFGGGLADDLAHGTDRQT